MNNNNTNNYEQPETTLEISQQLTVCMPRTVTVYIPRTITVYHGLNFADTDERERTSALNNRQLRAMMQLVLSDVLISVAWTREWGSSSRRAWTLELSSQRYNQTPFNESWGTEQIDQMTWSRPQIDTNYSILSSRTNIPIYHGQNNHIEDHHISTTDIDLPTLTENWSTEQIHQMTWSRPQIDMNTGQISTIPPQLAITYPDHNQTRFDDLNLSVEIPNEFICPISKNIMDDPVTISDEKHSYNFDRLNLEHWLQQKKTNPLTGLEVNPTTILPNENLKNKIIGFIDEHEYKAKLKIVQQELLLGKFWQEQAGNNSGEESIQNDKLGAHAHNSR